MFFFLGGGALHSIHALIQRTHSAHSDFLLFFGPVWSGASPGIGSIQLLSYESEEEAEVHEQRI